METLTDDKFSSESLRLTTTTAGKDKRKAKGKAKGKTKGKSKGKTKAKGKGKGVIVVGIIQSVGICFINESQQFCLIDVE
jgi:hypothetical protein